MQRVGFSAHPPRKAATIKRGMNRITIAVALALSVNSGLRAASITNPAPGGDFLPAAGLALSVGVAPVLPGFGLDECTILPVSTDVLNPSATFSVDMKRAFLTSEGTALIGIEIDAASRTGGRRVRSVAGGGPNAVGASGSGGTPLTGASGGQNTALVVAVAVPEPGTLFTGVLLLGVCASRSGARGSRQSRIVETDQRSEERV